MKLELTYQQMSYIREVVTAHQPKIFSIDERIREDVLEILQIQETEAQTKLQDLQNKLCGLQD
jgi:hypothetical protein